MNMRNAVIAVVVVLIVAGIWLLTQNKGNLASSTTAPEQSSPGNSPSETSMNEQEITVNGSEFLFEPAAMNLTKGQKVKITFNNQGKFPHNLVVSDLDVATKTIQPNQTDTVEFTPDRSGTFNFVCTVDEHEQKGMKGTLTIQ